MKNNVNIYLDIDGVLLANEQHAAEFADEFLQYVLKNYPETTYWLTTHCWQGENRAVEVLEPHLQPETTELLKQVQATNWGEYKTEAIDYCRPFLWFDDELYDSEETSLSLVSMLDNHIRVDLTNNPKQLAALIEDFPKPACLTMFKPNEINEALSAIARHNKAYTTLLQKELRIGYARAVNLMARLEYEGYIECPRDGSFGKVYLDRISVVSPPHP